jgi:hypothetical protein
MPGVGPIGGGKGLQGDQGLQGFPGLTGPQGVAGANGAPGSGGGAVVLLEQHTASGSATLDFTSCITATYDEYIIEFVEIMAANNAVAFGARVSTDGGATWDATSPHYYNNNNWAVNATWVNVATPGTYIQLAHDLTNGGILGVVGAVRFFPNGNNQRSFVGQTMYLPSAANRATNLVMCDYEQGAFNALRFLMTAGNFSGTIRIYGVAKNNNPIPYEYDYAQWTTSVNITATTEATANTIVSGNPVVYDGATIVVIEAFIPSATKGTTYTQFWLFDGSSSIGAIGVCQVAGGTSLKLETRLTPSAGSHTYSLRGSVDGATGTATGGAGGAGAYRPGFIRITSGK